MKARESNPQHVRAVNSNFNNTQYTDYPEAMRYGVYGGRPDLVPFVGGDLGIVGAKIDRRDRLSDHPLWPKAASFNAPSAFLMGASEGGG